MGQQTNEKGDPVDVLAVLRRHAVAERDRLGATDNDTQAALAAVAELIEAAQSATEERLHDGASSRSACDRLVAALARCRGGES